MTMRLDAAASRDTGSALILTLLVTGLLTTFGVMLAAVGDTERAVAANCRAATDARYAADAAAERVLADLIAAPQWTDYLSGASRSGLFDSTSTPTTIYGEVIDLSAATAALQADTDSGTVWGPNTPRWRLIASGPLRALTGSIESQAYLTAWIADDPDEIDGNPLVDANGVVTIRARAQGPLGARRDVQVTLARAACGESGMCNGGSQVRVLSWREIQ
jgi:hypothetical protein